MKNILNKIKNALRKLYTRSYGMDEINTVLLISSLVISIVQLFLNNIVLSIISLVLMIIFLFRYFSTKKFKRSEENRVFRKEIKYIKTKWNYRKTHKIFKCKKCGQLIRVPKGHGNIITTCPNCGNKEEHKS